MAKVRYARSSAEIIRKIGCSFLRLYRGEGYWYFIFDDEHGGRYDSESIYCMRLNDMALSRWVESGKAFVARVEAR